MAKFCNVYFSVVKALQHSLLVNKIQNASLARPAMLRVLQVVRWQSIAARTALAELFHPSVFYSLPLSFSPRAFSAFTAAKHPQVCTYNVVASQRTQQPLSDASADAPRSPLQDRPNNPFRKLASTLVPIYNAISELSSSVEASSHQLACGASSVVTFSSRVAGPFSPTFLDRVVCVCVCVYFCIYMLVKKKVNK